MKKIIVAVKNIFAKNKTVELFATNKEATLSEISEQEYILTPGRYVGIAEQEDDGEPFDEKMNRLTSELYGLFEESHKLEDEICKKLTAIGYGK